jgi:dihydrofolate reductase
VDENWGIGYNGRLLVQIPMDQKVFRQETMGKVVIMGRKTFEGLPGQRPLDGRINIVLSTKPDFAPKGVHVTRSVEETLALLERYKQKNCREEDIFVIGGEQIYRAFLPYCDTAHITQIEYKYTADTYMVNLEESDEWEMTDESDELTYFDVIFYFRKYQRIHK